MHLASIIAAIIFFAQGNPPPDASPESGGAGASSAAGPETMLPTIIMMGAVFLFMYLLIFRPQRQKEQEEKSMLERLKKNDHVVTRGGMFGIVMNVKDDEVVLKVDEQQNVKIRFQKAAIAQILTGESSEKKEDAAAAPHNADSKEKKG